MLEIKTDLVENAIREVANQIILPRFQHLQLGEIHFKGADDPVTIADQEAEIALKTRLLDLLPGSKLVGEEAFASDSSLLDSFSGESPVWIVDPVDGTKAFVSGEPVFGVIVALTKRNETLAGWLYDPNTDEFVTAEKGAGAFYKGKKLSVLPPAPLEGLGGTVRSMASETSGEAPRDCVSRPEGPVFYPVRSACHDYACLVVGEAHFSRQTPQLHFHGTHDACTPWDNAAGVLIHGEAGGYSSHWDGEPFRPSHYGKGLLSAPDKESWLALREWVGKFCPLEAGAL